MAINVENIMDAKWPYSWTESGHGKRDDSLGDEGDCAKLRRRVCDKICPYFRVLLPDDFVIRVFCDR